MEKRQRLQDDHGLCQGRKRAPELAESVEECRESAREGLACLACPIIHRCGSAPNGYLWPLRNRHSTPRGLRRPPEYRHRAGQRTIQIIRGRRPTDNALFPQRALYPIPSIGSMPALLPNQERCFFHWRGASCHHASHGSRLEKPTGLRPGLATVVCTATSTMGC